MDTRIYEASMRGDINSVKNLLEQDRLVLDRAFTGFHETPLHIAVMCDHVEFAKEILRLKPEYATEFDSQGFTPLHVASARKNLDMVNALVRSNPVVCMNVDQDGRTPLHLAAMKGRLPIMEVLFRTRPQAVMLLMDGRETILHLCVKHNRFEALKFLVDELVGVPITDEDYVSVNSKDDDGNTILHLAVAWRRMKMIKYLLQSNIELDINSVNKMNFTALDTIAQSCARDLKHREIEDVLRDAGVVRARELQVPAVTDNDDGQTIVVTTQQPSWGSSTNSRKKHPKKEYDDWLSNKWNALMVVASLIATMSFQAGLNPPGGVWQDDPKNNSTGSDTVSATSFNPYLLRYAGTSILAYRSRLTYYVYIACNTVGFMASLSIILLLVSGLPYLNRRLFVWILMVVMWVAISSMAVTYLVALSSMIPPFISLGFGNVRLNSLDVWLGALVPLALILFLHITHFSIWLVRKVGIPKIIICFVSWMLRVLGVLICMALPRAPYRK